MYVSVYVNVCVNVYMCVYVRMCVYVNVPVNAYVCVRVLNLHFHRVHHSVVCLQSLTSSTASSSAQLGTTFGIAIGSVAIFVVLVVAVVMLRRRSSSRINVTHGYVEVDPAASPEERHVANMQMNGYENPTYRYFEVQSAK